MQRREFLTTTAAAALLTSSDSSAATQSDRRTQRSIPKIDTHQHLWDLSRFQPPWLSGAPPVLAQSYVTSDYISATRGLDIVRTVYMEVDVAVADQNREAAHVIELSRSEAHPTCAGIISGRPNSEAFEAYIRQHADSKHIRGVRQVLHVDGTERGHCLEPQFVKSVQLLGTLGRTFDLCMRPTELNDAAGLAELCPETTLILDHCGNADPRAFVPDSAEEPWHTVDEWKRGLAAFAGHDNAYCKISGIVARAPQGWNCDHLAPIVEFCLETFGFDRVVFGSDWPVCLLGGPLASWVAALNEVIAERPATERRKLYHDNAVRVYGLDALV